MYKVCFTFLDECNMPVDNEIILDASEHLEKNKRLGKRLAEALIRSKGFYTILSVNKISKIRKNNLKKCLQNTKTNV